MDNDVQKIKSALSQYIVRPLNQFGFGGFIFDVAGDATVTLQNEITDHFTEDNTTINDQIAVKPKRVTLKNFVGELADLVGNETVLALQRVAQKLTILSELLPNITTTTEQLRESVDESIEADTLGIPTTSEQLDPFVDLFALTKNLLPPVTKQEQAYLYFKSLYSQKILVGLQTPFEFMPNMVIETIVAKQGEDTRFISDFTITLKEIRFADTQFVKPQVDQSRRTIQNQSVENLGKKPGTEQNKSLFCKATSAVDSQLDKGCQVLRAED